VTISLELLSSIRKHEGFRAKVYKCSEGFDTIGYGFAIKDLVLDEDIANIILQRKLEALVRSIEFKFSWYADLPNAVKDVVIEMCFQLGLNGFSKFKKTIEHLQCEEWELAADECLISRWQKQTPNRAKALSDKLRVV
jgi:lysozyme